MQARNLFFLVVCVSPLIVNSAQIQLNMTRHDHRRLLPFNPDPGGNITCIAAGDPACGTHGECIANWLSQTNWTCQCNQGWFTRRVDALNHTSICTTKQPSQLTALLLQIFLGWVSVGAFYLGWNIYATIPFMVIAGVCVVSMLWCLVPSSKKTKDRDGSATYSVNVNNDGDGKSCVSCCGIFGIIVTIITMWIVNLTLIITDCHNKEGIPCLPM